MDRKIKIGVFTNTLQSENLRGANRLFHSIYGMLANRDDIALILLDAPVPYEISPNATLYYCRDLSDPLAAKKSFIKVPLEEMLLFIKKINRGLRRMQGYYQHTPAIIRMILKPFVRLGFRCLNRLYRSAEYRLQKVYEPLARRGMERLTMPQLFKALFFPPSFTFSNDIIANDVMDIRDLDAIFNFWWFHLPFETPMLDVCVPHDMPVYSWFLDASPLRLPHWQSGLINEADFRQALQPHLQACTRVVAISHSAGDDATRFFHVPAERVAVIPCGLYEQDFNLRYDAVQLKKLGLDPNVPIVVVLGIQEPTKNIVNILKAIHKLSLQDSRPLQCVFMGSHHGFNPRKRFSSLLEKIPAHVRLIFTGSVNETEKCAVMSRSAALFYPSVWEGFGIPPLEAMAAGVPVITSDVASLPEVCGDHAIYCDPYDVQDMAQQLLHVLRMGEAERAERIAAAKTYAAEWLWSKKAVPMLVDDLRSQLAKKGSM